MRTKDPMRSKRVEDLREIAFYWRDECLLYWIEKESLALFLIRKGMYPSVSDKYNMFCSVEENAKKKFWDTYVSWYKKEQLQLEMRDMNLSQRTKFIHNEVNKFFSAHQKKEKLC
jgi:hypothetical protein